MSAAYKINPIDAHASGSSVSREARESAFGHVGMVPARGPEGVLAGHESPGAPRGVKLFTARVARSGAVCRARLGTLWSFYPAHLLLDEETLESFARAPVQLGHGARSRCVGRVQSPRIVRDGCEVFVEAELALDTPRALRAVALGMRGISPGWAATQWHTRRLEGLLCAIPERLIVEHVAIVRCPAAWTTRILETQTENDK